MSDSLSSSTPQDRVVSLLSGIVQALVDHPEQMQISLTTDGESTVIHLLVHPEDLGKVIGKQGRTARSIRTILAAASSKLQQRFTLDVSEIQ